MEIRCTETETKAYAVPIGKLIFRAFLYFLPLSRPCTGQSGGQNHRITLFLKRFISFPKVFIDQRKIVALIIDLSLTLMQTFRYW